MNDRTAQPSAYLEALAEINRSLGHEARSRLGNLSLHVNLLGELLRKTDDREPKGRAQWERWAGRIDADVQQVVLFVERVLRLTRRMDESDTSFDLRAALVEIETLLGPYVKERRLEWTLEMPPGPVPARGRRPEIDRLVVARVVEAARTLPAGSHVGLRLDPDRAPETMFLEVRVPRGQPDRRELRLPLDRATPSDSGGPTG